MAEVLTYLFHGDKILRAFKPFPGEGIYISMSICFVARKRPPA
jgi:hypothetical protein